MRNFFALALRLTISTSLFAQEAKPEDVKSADAILTALYDVISGPAGEKRDWDRMKSLFIPEGRLMPTGKGQNGVSYRVWTVQEYIDQAGASLEKNGFFEVEVSRKIESYGTISHVFSTYESRRTLEDKEPFARGINSIQLLNDGDRWWIVSVFWMGETPEFQLPKKYLKKVKKKRGA
ncbi:hypothetical protein [Roseivirga misakiensis]|uniref:DUF4440 domain-containing protein n=1 Tax=Roseivirga misakiensis TaxID=1563681 RepID=A0A1E5SZH3_9BACT|nr:hypothetical protein [Roseivirga misakiensis]OEK04528.1 hypothetical protein BFP71_13760 [Roseivirga misakiensis]